jgi:hypothetical protein
MRSIESYEAIFSSSAPIGIWPKIAMILKKTDLVLERNRPSGSSATEGFLKKWRHITCLLAVSKMMSTFDYSINDLVLLNIDELKESDIEAAWHFVRSYSQGMLDIKAWKRKGFLVNICHSFSAESKITGAQRVERGYWPSGQESRKKIVVDFDFATKVNALLPAQPWKSGIHREIAKRLKCTIQDYFNAVGLLIEKGFAAQTKGWCRLRCCRRRYLLRPTAR